MINRELKTVSVVSYTAGIDIYGQERQLGSTTRNTEMVLHIYSQNNVSDPRFVDIELHGLTKDPLITTANSIVADNITYDVKYVIPSGKYYQILMKRKA